MADISGAIAIFVAIVAAAVVFLYLGTIGLKRDKKDDQMHKPEEVSK